MSETPKPIGSESRVKPENIRNTLTDITLVGPEKPLGYLSFSFIANFGERPQQLITESETKGLNHRVIEVGSGETADQLLYVYDKEALQKLLDNRREVLEKVDWPIDADEFVEHVSKNNAPQETDLFDVVADAFADYENVGRKTYPKPLTTSQRFKIALTKLVSASQFAGKRRAFYQELNRKRLSKGKGA